MLVPLVFAILLRNVDDPWVRNVRNCQGFDSWQKLGMGDAWPVNNGCGMMLRLSLSGGFVEIQGDKFLHSPSNCAN